MIVLNNRDVQQLLTMDMCLAALEEAYGQYSRGEAVLVHRNDMLIESEGDYSKGLLYPDDNDPLQHASPMFRHARRGIEGPYYFSLKTMPAAVKRGGPFNIGCAALRLNIDILANTRSISGGLRRQQIPAAPGNRYSGLVMLWKTENAEPICVLPDAWLEGIRVGATNALAAKYLAKKNPTRYALIGSGLQARAQLEAMLAVFPTLSDIRVWSPTREHRELFAAEQAKVYGRRITAAKTLEAAADGADIVGSATNSMEAIFKDPALLGPGMFLTTINTMEADPAVLKRCNVLALHANNVSWPEDAAQNVFTPKDARQFYAWWCTEGVRKNDPLVENIQESSTWLYHYQREHRLPSFFDVIGGRCGRESDSQITGFVNNVGLGLQFAAVGAVIYQKALDAGIGTQVPTELFTQELHG